MPMSLIDIVPQLRPVEWRCCSAVLRLLCTRNDRPVSDKELFIFGTDDMLVKLTKINANHMRQQLVAHSRLAFDFEDLAAEMNKKLQPQITQARQSRAKLLKALLDAGIDGQFPDAKYLKDGSQRELTPSHFQLAHAGCPPWDRAFEFYSSSLYVYGPHGFVEEYAGISIPTWRPAGWSSPEAKVPTMPVGDDAVLTAAVDVYLRRIGPDSEDNHLKAANDYFTYVPRQILRDVRDAAPKLKALRGRPRGPKN